MAEMPTITLAATGNGFKSHDRYDTFIEVSGGYGNRGDGEVHLLIRQNDGGQFAQSWFVADDLIAAILHVTKTGEAGQ